MIKDIEKTIHAILNEPFWPKDLTEDGYSRVQDDCDGDKSQILVVSFSQDSDVWVRTIHFGALRFRGPFGGGMSPRVRNALLILAMAIKKDNEDWPQE